MISLRLREREGLVFWNGLDCPYDGQRGLVSTLGFLR